MTDLEFRAWWRSLTFESPKWVSRAEALVRAGDKGMIRLLSGYLPVLPPELRAAVLDARARYMTTRSQVVKNMKPSFQIREPRVTP